MKPFAVMLFCWGLAGCSLSLRTHHWPEALSALQLKGDSQSTVYHAVAAALQAQGVTLVESDAPQITLGTPHTDLQVVAVNRLAYAVEYSLYYRIPIRLSTATTEFATEVRVQRSLINDPHRPLAWQQEQAMLQTKLEQEAVQRILAQLQQVKL